MVNSTGPELSRGHQTSLTSLQPELNLPKTQDRKMTNKTLPYTKYQHTKTRVQALVVARYPEHSNKARTSSLSLVTADGLHTKATVYWPAHMAFATQESLSSVSRNLEEVALVQLTKAQLQREGYGQEICLDMTA